MQSVYPAVLKQDEDGYFISFPDSQNGFTEGEDLSDATAKGINFSALLQESIAEKLGYKVSDNKK